MCGPMADSEGAGRIFEKCSGGSGAGAGDVEPLAASVTPSRIVSTRSPVALNMTRHFQFPGLLQRLMGARFEAGHRRPAGPQPTTSGRRGNFQPAASESTAGLRKIHKNHKRVVEPPGESPGRSCCTATRNMIHCL